MPALHTITPQQLMRRIGTPDCPVLVDLRLPEDRALAPGLIPTSQAMTHSDIEALLAHVAGRPSVMICHGGLKISHGAAAVLRSEGLTAEVLDGGHSAWLAAAYPLIPADLAPTAPTLWVTRHRPKIDRIACPWLIRRFIDPDARFLFVPPDEVAGVADRFGATAFDMAGAPYGHVDERCTFDALVQAYGLSHAALDRLAALVRAADTGRLDAAPEAAGLLAFSVGLSRLYSDDHAQLQAGLPLYDALYRWARDGQNETHGHAQ